MACPDGRSHLCARFPLLLALLASGPPVAAQSTTVDAVYAANSSNNHLLEIDFDSATSRVLNTDANLRTSLQGLVVRDDGTDLRVIVCDSLGGEAAAVFEEANVKANLSGRKEVAVESRIELGRLSLEHGKLANAERLLLRTREEAAQARLRPLEAEAAAALAEVYLARKDAEGARRAARDAIGLAEKFSGRPVVYRASATLAEALERLGRSTEALDSHARAADALEWIRGSLRPEHVAPFMGRAEVQAFLARAVPKLEKGGRGAQAAALGKWKAASSAARPSGS